MSLWPLAVVVSVWSTLGCALVALRWLLLPGKTRQVLELEAKLKRANERAEALSVKPESRRAGPPYSFAERA